VGPIEIAEQGPDEIACQRRAVVNRLGSGAEVLPHVINPRLVVNPPVLSPPIGEAAAVLRDAKLLHRTMW
jgi:hypothetical protein